MTMMKLASFFFLTTLSIQMNAVQGDGFLTRGDDKNSQLKVTEKRINNFRVPVEMPYDPNFWPARGRRGRADKTENYFLLNKSFADVKSGIQSPYTPYMSDNGPPKIITKLDVQNLGTDFQNEFLKKTPENCFEMRGRPDAPEECSGNLKLAEFLERNLVQPNLVGNWMDRRSHHKKHKYFEVPEFMLSYGDGVYLDLDNSYGEKEKKQDVFWVARGKKTFK